MKPQEVTQYMDAVSKGLGKLAIQMKQPVEQVYELFYRQNYVSGIMGIIQILTVVILTVFYIKFLKWGFGESKRDKNNNNFYWNDGAFFTAIGIGGILIISILVIFLGGFEEVLSRFINPHYMTIKDIIYLVKPN